MKNTWFFEVLAYLIIFTIFDHILGLINFKSNLTYTLAETGTAYVLFLIFGYVFHWISFTFTNLLGTTLLFLFIATIGITYLTYRHKLRTKELNDLIQKQNR